MKTIRELREERGWSRRHMAGLIGVDQMTIYKWERGTHTPSAVHWRKLADAFAVSMDDIRLPALNGKDDHADD